MKRMLVAVLSTDQKSISKYVMPLAGSGSVRRCRCIASSCAPCTARTSRQTADVAVPGGCMGGTCFHGAGPGMLGAQSRGANAGPTWCQSIWFMFALCSLTSTSQSALTCSTSGNSLALGRAALPVCSCRHCRMDMLAICAPVARATFSLLLSLHAHLQRCQREGAAHHDSPRHPGITGAIHGHLDRELCRCA